MIADLETTLASPAIFGQAREACSALGGALLRPIAVNARSACARRGSPVFGFIYRTDGLLSSSEELGAAWGSYIETCIAAFGPERAMFESNFPVDKGSYSYPVFWNACKLLAKAASAAEKTDLFAGTAARFYRLDGFA